MLTNNDKYGIILSRDELEEVNGFGLVQTFAHDKLGRQTESKISDSCCTSIYSKKATYLKYGDHTTDIIADLTYRIANGNTDREKYSYDKEGNISAIHENGRLKVRYTYDALNRLIREDNKELELTTTFEYDNGGNLIRQNEYAYSLVDTDELIDGTEIVYTYAESRSDMLTDFNGEAITYDANGCPETYRDIDCTFTRGTLLKTYGTYSKKGFTMKKFLSLFLMLTVVTIVMATLLSCQKSDMLGDADDSILSIDTTKESSKNSETNFYNETGTNTSSTSKPELSAEEKWNTKASKGLAFTSNNDGTCLVSGKGSCSDFYIIIPTHSSKGDLVIGIGSYAFMNCEEITSVSMPDSIKSIGSGAFSDCSRLTSVAMGNGVKEIGRNAFYECSALNSINIPNSVSNIGEYAFSGCCGLTSINIPGSVMSIGGSAFSHCSRLKSVTISDGVKEIGVAAFDCCISLTSVTIPKSVTEIEGNAFVDCDALDTINYTGTEMQWSSIDKRYAEIPKSVIINYNYGK